MTLQYKLFLLKQSEILEKSINPELRHQALIIDTLVKHDHSACKKSFEELLMEGNSND